MVRMPRLRHKPLLCISIFLVISGCKTAIKNTALTVGADVTTPYLETEIPKRIEETFKVGLEKSRFREALRFMKFFKGPIGKLKPFFEKEEKEAFSEFYKEVTPFLKEKGTRVEDFDLDKDGIIKYNEYVRICIHLRKEGSPWVDPWVEPGHRYLAMRYLNKLVVTPCVNTLQYFASKKIDALQKNDDRSVDVEEGGSSPD